MGKKFKVPKVKQKIVYSSIVKPTEVVSGRISFNFSRLCEKSGKFEYSNRNVNYFKKLIERLKSVSDLTREIVCTSFKDVLRAHQIKFKEDKRLTESTFGLDPHLDDDAWQLQICSNKHGRIHGYFVGNVFYIVWFDPDHNLYRR